MKLKKRFLITIIILSLSFYILPKFFLFLFRVNIVRLIPEYKVTIADLKIGLNYLLFTGVGAVNDNRKIEIQDLKIAVPLRGFMTGKVFRVNADNARIHFKSQKSEIFSKGKIAFDYEASKQKAGNIEFDLDELNISGIKMKGLKAKTAQCPSVEALLIESIKYDKNSIENIKGGICQDKMTFNISKINGNFWRGEINGDIALTIDKEIQYEVKLEIINIDLGDIGKGYNLTDRIDMSGKVAGSLAIKGRGGIINDLTGEFLAADPGGELNITDQKLLGNIVKYTAQSSDILMESFKNYNYSKGNARLFLNGNDIALNINLNGERGKRGLQIVLHDFDSIFKNKK